MKENKELERHDIAIDREMEVDCDIGQEITVYIETWFDVDKKFGTQLNGNDSAWLNLYGKYNSIVLFHADWRSTAACGVAVCGDKAGGNRPVAGREI